MKKKSLKQFEKKKVSASNTQSVCGGKVLNACEDALYDAAAEGWFDHSIGTLNILLAGC